MYRHCPECNNGAGRRLAPGEVSCPEEHDSVFCVLEVGDVVGDFQIDMVLPAGEGGYATVYRAKALVSGYPPLVALKIAAVHHRAALEQEVKALALLHQDPSPYIVQIYPLRPQFQTPVAQAGLGTTHEYLGRAIVDLESFYFLALGYLDNGSLRSLLDRRKRGGLDPLEALRIGRQVGMALEEVHRVGLLHLDVKPSNIMFNQQGATVLVDFSIAVAQSGSETKWPGTAPYAPREQINQDYPDKRADVHALGVTVFEMLTGQLPYTGSSATALANAVRTRAPLRVSQVSPSLKYLDDVLDKAMSPDADARYASVADFLGTLTTAIEQRIHVRQRKWRLGLSWATGATALLIAGFLLFPSVGVSSGSRTATPTIMRAAATATIAPAITPTNPLLVAPSNTPVVEPPTFTPVVETPTLVTQVDSTVAAPDLLQPDDNAVFMGPDAKVVFAWSDAGQPLRDGEYYVLDLLRPDSNRQQLISKEASLELPASIYNETHGTFSWRAYRASDRDPADPARRTSEYSRLRSFVWQLAPTDTPTPPITPTVTAAIPTLTSDVRPTVQPSATPKIASAAKPTSTRPIAPTSTVLPSSPTAVIDPPTATLLPAPPITEEVLPPTAMVIPPTPQPPTALPVLPTSTAVPPTAPPVLPTSTAVPPTDTAVPPTDTAVPPTSTAVPPTDTPKPTKAPKPEPTDTPEPEPTDTPQPVDPPGPEPTDMPEVPPTPCATRNCG